MTSIEQWRWEQEEIKTIPWHFYNTCERFPNRNAQLFNGKLYPEDSKGSLTWKELMARVESIGLGLMSLGLNKGDRAAIMSQSTPYWTHADMALACTGGVSVTIFPTMIKREIEYIMNNSESRFIFVGDEGLLEKVMESFNDIPKLETVIILDFKYTGTDRRIIGLKELVERGESLREEYYEKYIQRRDSIELNDWYTIIYTSGTTSSERGVILTHFNCSSKVSGTDEFLERYNMAISENDTTLCYLPLSHIFDRTSCALLAIYHGATIAYADKLETLLDDLRKYNPTWMNCVPRIYEKIYLRLKAILDQRPFRRRIVLWAMKIDREVFEYRKDANGCYNMHRDFKVRSKLGLLLRWKFRFARGVLIRIKLLFGSRLRYAFSGTAPIPAELVKFFHAVGVRVVEGYGLTESFGGCIVNPITACKPGYIGINACGGQSRISADGELEIKGAGVFKEYLKDSEWTEELFTDDGWFKTGDLADVDEHGYYRILDRKKSIICTDTGKNISPFKIVELFSSSDYIDQVLVIGDGRSYITALIVPKFNYFIDIFERESVRYKKDLIVWDDEGEFRTCVKVGDDFTLNFRLQDLIKGEVDKVNTELEVYEKIKQYTILTEKFTQQNGLLSSSQKVKKKEIIEKYLYVIDKMYM